MMPSQIYDFSTAGKQQISNAEFIKRIQKNMNNQKRQVIRNFMKNHLDNAVE